MLGLTFMTHPFFIHSISKGGKQMNKDTRAWSEFLTWFYNSQNHSVERPPGQKAIHQLTIEAGAIHILCQEFQFSELDINMYTSGKSVANLSPSESHLLAIIDMTPRH
jgi:hypothetical protein